MGEQIGWLVLTLCCSKSISKRCLFFILEAQRALCYLSLTESVQSAPVSHSTGVQNKKQNSLA